MDWLAFLEDVAIECELSPDQKRAFLARFDRMNAGKTEKWIAANVKDERGDLVFSGEAAYKKLMTAVYKAFQVSLFPELATIAKGKREKLGAWLKAEFERRAAVQGEGRSPLQPDALSKSGMKPGVRAAVQEEGRSPLQPDALSKLGMKPGAPLPGVRLPDNFVARTGALEALKGMLLAEDSRNSVMSVIAGFGGVGKSVLATAIVLDAEVQGRFEDGILWVTLGQNPDLLSCLGDLIRVLDKSRDSFSANTVEEASRYLGTLLADQWMLLVVDDVSDVAHANLFLVGGPNCRLLVTTRIAVISGAERYSLDVMSPEESLELIQGELGAKWTGTMEQPALDFAELLGYLPLALQLIAVQVGQGRKWEMLKEAFLKERKFQSLDHPGVTLVDLSEEKRREYNVRTFVQVSLDRLKEDRPDYFDRFVWVGVLPKDVEIRQQMALVLWDAEDWEAEETLIELCERSFLTIGVATFEGKSTYRVHDLIHDMAKGLIEEGTLALPILNSPFTILNSAHRSFLDQYRKLAIWNELPMEDLYIFRHLTWHLEQANLTDEVHELLAMSDGHGRNAWFEACDRIGQPAIFVEDVARGWRLAEELYAREKARAIVLQCRYALITSTLHSLLKDIPVRTLTKLIGMDFWTVQNAWDYMLQIKNKDQIVEIVEILKYHITLSFLMNNAGNAQLIISKYVQLKVPTGLIPIDITEFTNFLNTMELLQHQYSNDMILNDLKALNANDFTDLIEVWRSYLYRSSRVNLLHDLADKAPQNLLMYMTVMVATIMHRSTDAQILSECLPRLPLANLPYSDWCAHLGLLARREREDLMRDLATLYPAILHLGGEAAGRGMVDGMREVCGQWK